jgi:hypothetical protein
MGKPVKKTGLPIFLSEAKQVFFFAHAENNHRLFDFFGR